MDRDEDLVQLPRVVPPLPLLLGRKDLESRTVFGIRGEEACDATVERRKAPTSSDRQIEEHGIRNLSVAHQPLADLALHLMEGTLEGPEFMFGRQHIRFQNADGVGSRDGCLDDGRLCGEPNETHLRHRAGSPASIPLRPKPRVGHLVMKMVRPRERHQNVEVE